MTLSREQGPEDAVYEVTVVGRLGPVLLTVLAPLAATASSGSLTIMRLRGRDGQDLLDILQLLGPRALDATTISAIA